MRWGVREEASIDHSTSELCLKEIKACNELSLGPTFVVRNIGSYADNINAHVMDFVSSVSVFEPGVSDVAESSLRLPASSVPNTRGRDESVH